MAGSVVGGPPEVDVEGLVERAVRAMAPLMLALAERAESAARERLQEERALRM